MGMHFTISKPVRGGEATRFVGPEPLTTSLTLPVRYKGGRACSAEALQGPAHLRACRAGLKHFRFKPVVHLINRAG